MPASAETPHMLVGEDRLRDQRSYHGSWHQAGAVLLPLLLVWLQPTSADAGGAGCASPPCGVNQYEIIVDGEARCCPVVDGDKSGIGKQSGWGNRQDGSVANVSVALRALDEDSWCADPAWLAGFGHMLRSCWTTSIGYSNEATDGGSPTESGILLMLQPATNGAVAVVSQEIRARSLVKRCRVLNRLRVPERAGSSQVVSACSVRVRFAARISGAPGSGVTVESSTPRSASRARVAARPAYLDRVTRGIAA